MMLVVLLLIIIALVSGVLIGRWVWAGRRFDVAAKEEEQACYKKEVGEQLGVVLDALDQVRDQVKRSASELGEPVLMGKAERTEQAALASKDGSDAEQAEPVKVALPDADTSKNDDKVA